MEHCGRVVIPGFYGRVPNGRIKVMTRGGSDITGADAVQQPVGRVGKPEDIAEMALFLCSEKAGFITGENICIDGGMTRLMIYHGDHGWRYDGRA